jgi:hypothetical protein
VRDKKRKHKEMRRKRENDLNGFGENIPSS